MEPEGRLPPRMLEQAEKIGIRTLGEGATIEFKVRSSALWLIDIGSTERLGRVLAVWLQGYEPNSGGTHPVSPRRYDWAGPPVSRGLAPPGRAGVTRATGDGGTLSPTMRRTSPCHLLRLPFLLPILSGNIQYR